MKVVIIDVHIVDVLYSLPNRRPFPGKRVILYFGTCIGEDMGEDRRFGKLSGVPGGAKGGDGGNLFLGLLRLSFGLLRLSFGLLR